MEQMNRSKNEGTPRNYFTVGTVSTVAVAAIGGYLLWRNRSKIQQLLSDAGIDTHMLDGKVDKVKSGIAKIGTSLKHETNKPDSIFSSAV